MPYSIISSIITRICARSYSIYSNILAGRNVITFLCLTLVAYVFVGLGNGLIEPTPRNLYPFKGAHILKNHIGRLRFTGSESGSP